MIKKIIKNKLFIALLLIITILFIIKIISNKKNNTYTSTLITPTETAPVSSDPSKQTFSSPSSQTDQNTLNPTPTIKITEINFQIPLYDFLPYQGKYFRANRYLKANNIEVKVFNRENTDLAKQEIQQWLSKYQVENLDTYTIIY